MKKFSLITIFIRGCVLPGMLCAQDVEGAKDHPLFFGHAFQIISEYFTRSSILLEYGADD
ncbi:MAG: hypothetical protein OEM20_02030 [Gammaproteobacteria bacterium]|nr:hypothetical protein [Gammaproteobacteria bacterium]